MSTLSSSQRAAGLAIGIMCAFALINLDAQQGPPAQVPALPSTPPAAPSATCRVTGNVTSAGVPLPGVAITIKAGPALRAATSTELGGAFSVPLAPGEYTLSADLTGFTRAERTVTVTAGPTCNQSLNISMPLAPRTPLPAPVPAPVPATSGTTGAATGAANTGTQAPGRAAAPGTQTQTAQNGRTGRGGRGGAQQQPSIDTLQLQQTEGAQSVTANENDNNAGTQLLLPPGFSTDQSSDAIAINGNNASVDRSMMNDRMNAIGRGEFDPASGDFGQGFGPGGQGPGGAGGLGGGRGGPDGRGGFGGQGGRGGFFLGGRGARQNRYNLTANYTLGSSALDSAPFQLRSNAPTTKAPYTKNTFGATAGGPLKIPGIYDGTNRTNFVVSYNGNHSSNLFDQYATLPSAAERSGDFSALGVPVINPLTGLPFANNQIPVSMLNPAALALLRFIPEPNLTGSSQNYQALSTYGTSRDALSVRVTQNFTPNVQGGGRGGRGGFGGGFGGRGGGRSAVTGTAINMTAQMQYTHSANDSLNVLPLLGGHSASTSLALPVNLNIRHGRTAHIINVQFSDTSSSTTNHYSGVENVAGEAGIPGVATDAFGYGVPSLSFANFSVHDVTPSKRTDQRLTTSYTWTKPWKTHQLRAGGDFRLDRSNSESDANAAGAFTFTGLYTGGGTGIVTAPGLDFADFLLGLPQQATVQYGPGNIELRDKSTSAFFQDDWRESSKLTLSLGVRYELIFPYTDAQGHMVNLDPSPDFTAVTPVTPGQTGPFDGKYPSGLIRPDINNVAPRLGLAYRITPGFLVRGGYGVSYNSGSYSTIARELASQPPFATSNTVIGTAVTPLLLTNPFVTPAAGILNNYGIDPNYQLGRLQTLNVDISKDLTQAWVLSGGYTRTTGSDLDMVRAPNRLPGGGYLDPNAQPFLWQTSQGISVLNAGTVRLQRRMVHGIGGIVIYTRSRSMDNASNYGGGGTVVAQNDQDLGAEYSLSSFNRTNQLTGNISFELPFGQNKPWLNGGGTWAAIFGGWRGAASVVWESGTPLTPRVLNSVSDVASGVSGTLRADYLGGPIQLADPTIGQFFNTAAFGMPPTGQFGTALRNMIIGPGSKMLNGQFSRDIRMGLNHSLTLQIQGTNILNLVNFATVNTVVNSSAFGQVTSVAPMRSVQLSFRFRY